MVLFIIGNGFDLHHGLKTSYDYYAAFLEDGDSEEKRNCLSFVLDDGKLDPEENNIWGSLEDKLNVDFRSLLLQTIEGHAYANSEDISLYQDFTDKYFVEWVNQISLAPAEAKMHFPDNALFLTFNYTLMLEKVYGISDERILHIHGKAGDDHLQFGSSEFMNHSDEDAEEPIFEYMRSHPSNPQYLKDARDYLAYAKKIFGKDPKKNYSRISGFLGAFEFDKVIVMGPSLSTQDKPYFEQCLWPRLKNAEWIIVYHDEKDRANKDCFVQEVGIRASFVNYEEMQLALESF